MNASLTADRTTPRVERAPGFWRRIAPVFGLFLLAPFIAEYLLGNVSIRDFWGLVPFLAPMYGGGALLVREIARRTGGGWPTIMLLALAYGLLEAGLLDHSLFNPSYFDNDFQSAAHVPLLGISAYHALSFVIGHAVWSIGIPIALVETFVPSQRTTPWLGKVGLAVCALVFAAGSAIIFDDHRTSEQLLPSMPQVAGTLAVITALIGSAFAVRRYRPAPLARHAPRPWQVGTVAFVVTTALFLVITEDWLGVVLYSAVTVAMTLLVLGWSRFAGWNARHRAALAGGTMLTYAWIGFYLTPIAGTADTLDLLGNSAFALGAVLLLVLATRKARHTVLSSKGA